MDEEFCYKIFDTRTGLFANGSAFVFSATGKIWKKLSHVKSHLILNKTRYEKNSYDRYVVVRYKIMPEEELTIQELINATKQRD